MSEGVDRQRRRAASGEKTHARKERRDRVLRFGELQIV